MPAAPATPRPTTPASFEHLVVVEGRLRVGPQHSPVQLEAGDLVMFSADVPHVYEAIESTRAVLLMSYP